MGGQEHQARLLAARLRREFAEQGNKRRISLLDEALTILELGLGNYADALHAALGVSSEQPMVRRRVAELVEAEVRCGDEDTAAAALAEPAPPPRRPRPAPHRVRDV
jgi:hypothetical protein